MGETYKEIQRYLKRFEYESHLERRIIEIVEYYPYLKKDLKREAKLGGVLKMAKFRGEVKEPQFVRRNEVLVLFLA